MIKQTHTPAEGRLDADPDSVRRAYHRLAPRLVGMCYLLLDDRVVDLTSYTWYALFLIQISAVLMEFRDSCYTYTLLGMKRPSSSVFDSIFLASGDGSDGDLFHYRAELVVLGLNMLGVSGELPGCILII